MHISRNRIIFSICFICAFVKVLQNIRNHFDLNYKITPILQLNKDVLLPGVSICFNDFIDEIRFQRVFPQIAKEIGNLSRLKMRHVRRSLYSRITLKQLSQVAFKLDDFLDSCVIYKNQIRQVNCTRLSPVIEWISYEDKCFQFFANRSQALNKFSFNRDMLVNQEWLTFKIAKKRIRKNDIGILVSSPLEILQPFAYNNGYKQLSTAFLSTLYIIIEKVKTIRLPPPYESNCRNYTNRLKSQANCLFFCYYEKYKVRGKYPDQLLTNNPEELYGIDLDKENRTTCTEKCKKRDCISDEFSLRISYKKLGSKIDKIKLVLKLSFNEDKRLVYEPASRDQNILSKVSFVLSPLAFFCGVSLLNINEYLLNVFLYLIAVCIRIKKYLVQKVS